MNYGLVSVWATLVGLAAYSLSALGTTSGIQVRSGFGASPGRRPFQSKSMLQRMVVLALLGGIVVTPAFFGSSLLSLTRGPIPETSIVTLFLSIRYLAVVIAFGRPQTRAGDEEKRLVFGLTAVGLVLFGTTLHDFGVDVYAFGYPRDALLIYLVIFCAIAWLLGRTFTALLLLSAALAWRMGVLESGNLWDYFVDPLLIVGGLVHWFINRKTKTPHAPLN